MLSATDGKIFRKYCSVWLIFLTKDDKVIPIQLEVTSVWSEGKQSGIVQSPAGLQNMVQSYNTYGVV